MSLTLSAAMTAIHDHFADTVWAGPVTVFGFENEVIDPAPGLADSWVRFVVRETESGQETMGPVAGRNFLRKGLAILQIFTPSDLGRKPADDLADTFKDGFEGVTVAGVRYHEVNRNVISQDGRWFQLNASAVFDYTERR